MNKYLISTVETYRVDTENEVDQLMEEAKAGELYELTKRSSQQKVIKPGKEDEEVYYLVSLTKTFTSAKEPDIQVDVRYEA